MESTGPQEVLAQACLVCGHCVAVCPKEAIDHSKSPLALQATIINVPDNKKITGVVMVGYPKYSYKRFTERQPLSFSFYKE